MAFQNNLSEFYNQDHLPDISKKGYYVEKINFFIDKLAQLSKQTKLDILDVACNEGYLSHKYAKYGNVLGVEMNKLAATECRKKGIDCLTLDIMQMPQKYNGKFNVVIAGDIIEHIFNTDIFLQKLNQLLKNQGNLLITTPNIASLARRGMLMLGKNPFLEYSTQLPYPEFNVGHIRYYTAANLKLQLERNGFKNVLILGDKINIIPSLAVPFKLAKHMPSISRNLMVYCQK